MKEQDFIPERRPRGLRDALESINGQAAAAATAASFSVLALLLAVLPPVPGMGVMAALASGVHSAAPLA